MKRENTSETKQEQEQKSKERFQGEHEEVTKHRRIIKEEPRRIKIETKKEEKHKETKSRVYGTSLLPKPLIIHSDLRLISKKVEPRIIPPSEVSLTERQKILLYILYNMFRGKNVKNIIAIVSKALGVDVEDLLRELITLENLNLIVVSNDVINFTSKGEIVVGTITIDRSLINKMRELITRVPKPPYVHVPGSITVKTLDREKYVAHMRKFRKEPIIPTIPSMYIGSITPLKIDKNLNIPSKYRVKQAIIPNIPQITSPEINTKVLNKATSIASTKKPEEVIEKPVTKVVEKIGEVAKAKGIRLPSSLLTMLFKPVRRHDVRGILKVKPDRPVIVIAIKPSNDDYIATLLSILREIYRIKVGGLPIGRYVGTRVSKYIAEDELTRQGLIKVIDDSKADFLRFFGISRVEDFDKIDLNKLRDRLTELSVQGLSFLVFYLNRDKAKSFLTYLAVLRDKISPAKIVVISPRELDMDQKRELARAAWGFIDLSERLITLDQHFKRREEEFNNVLENIVTKRRYAKIVRESIEDEEGSGVESALHYQLKVFIVYYLMRKLKIPEDDIETEVELLVGDRKIIPDVYVKSKRLAIEVETFYGTGFTPWRKLERTIEKYLESNVANEVWIVIPPMQAMLYLKDLVSEIKELEEKGYRFIKLYTIDLSKTKLVPIEKIPSKLSKLFSRIVKVPAGFFILSYPTSIIV